MATRPQQLDPKLQELVEKARAGLVEDGEWPPGRHAGFETRMGREAQDFVVRILRDGTYAAEVANIGREDPELADQ